MRVESKEWRRILLPMRPRFQHFLRDVAFGQKRGHFCRCSQIVRNGHQHALGPVASSIQQVEYVVAAETLRRPEEPI